MITGYNIEELEIIYNNLKAALCSSRDTTGWSESKIGAHLMENMIDVILEKTESITMIKFKAIINAMKK